MRRRRRLEQWAAGHGYNYTWRPERGEERVPGLSRDDHRNRHSRDLVVGDGWVALTYARRVRGAEEGTIECVVAAPLDRAVPDVLVRPTGRHGRSVERVWGAGVATGHPVFDATFHVDGSPLALTPAVREAMLSEPALAWCFELGWVRAVRRGRLRVDRLERALAALDVVRRPVR